MTRRYLPTLAEFVDDGCPPRYPPTGAGVMHARLYTFQHPGVAEGIWFNSRELEELGDPLVR